MTRKVVINSCFGGFGLSTAALLRYAELKGIEAPVYAHNIPRDCAALVQVVEELGEGANDTLAALRIVEIPADVDWGIHDYDGQEHVEEEHRTWA